MAKDDKKTLEIKGSFISKPEDWSIRKAIVKEEMGRLSEMRAELLCTDLSVKLKDLLGQDATIILTDAEQEEHYFNGIVNSVTKLALRGGLQHLLVEFRPWFWLLTKTTDSRIFQDLSSLDIIKQIFGEYGFSDFEDKTTVTYEKRVYCVQYRETDFDFLSRLMEEEGMYYYFDYPSEGKDTLVLCDGPSAHKEIDSGTIDILAGDDLGQKTDEAITDFAFGEAIHSKTMTLQDFDFEKPKADLTTRKNTTITANHKYNKYEVYDYPGRYIKRMTSVGEQFARVDLETEEQVTRPVWGTSTVMCLNAGLTFTAAEREDVEGISYLLTGTTHYLQVTDAYEEVTDSQGQKVKVIEGVDDHLKFPEGATDIYTASFFARDKTHTYRSQSKTPKPEISGLQTAIVTGKSGEEIWTDKYGRIKVQFHWDREGKNDENTTCWIRVATPWSGKNWGMIHIPRIGQEVVVQFEEGNPDRPICTGMLYNANTMPPYELPANQTQSGIVTRSTKQGSTETFHELFFEDKINEELVRFQSQKDYLGLIKDRSAVTVGLDAHDVTVDSTDEKSYALTVKNHMTELVQEGDHTFTVDTGNQIVDIRTDQTETVEGNSTRTVTGDHTETITEGDKTTDVVQGNQVTTVTSGDISVEASVGSIAITAGMEICLTVGGNSITIDNSGIVISGTMVTVEGTATVDVGSPSTTVAGDGMLTLDGGVTMIN